MSTGLDWLGRLGLVALLLLSPAGQSALAGEPAARTGGGDDIGNGGGLAEKNFLIAFQSLAKYVTPCLDLEACRLTDDQKRVLTAIVAAMPTELEHAELIQFRSGAENPGFFVLDCALKVAKTGLRVGDTIFVNTDLIYTKNRFGGDEAMSVTMALAVLIHELGHHVSRETHEQLDLLGVKVASFLQNTVETTPALPWSQSIMATIVQAPGGGSFPQILLTVGDSVADISPLYRAAVSCPKFVVPIPLLPFPDLQLGAQPPVGSLVHNVHWISPARTSEEGDYVIEGSLMNTCRSSPSVLMAVNSFQARISFSVRKDAKGGLSLAPGSVRVDQVYEPWYKFIRLPGM